MYNHRPWFPWAAGLLIVALTAGAAGALPRPLAARAADAASGRPHRQGGPGLSEGATILEPIIGPTSWYDALNDAMGLSWLDRTQLLTDRVRLGLTEELGENVSSIRALTEGPGGVLYMGTDESRLWSYDPITDTTVDLGMPVPDECNN